MIAFSLVTLYTTNLLHFTLFLNNSRLKELSTERKSDSSNIEEALDVLR